MGNKTKCVNCLLGSFAAEPWGPCADFLSVVSPIADIRQISCNVRQVPIATKKQTPRTEQNDFYASKALDR